MAWGKSLRGLFIVDDDKNKPAAEGVPTDPEEIERLLASVRTSTKDPSPTATPTPAPQTLKPVLAGKTFEAIYQERGVQPSKYPAEKLLKFLDAIHQMDVATRKSVVAAMVAAETSWTIEDVLNDAKLKINALQDAKANIINAFQATEAQAVEDQRATDTYLTEASVKIKQQIDELQALLAEETASVRQKKTQIDAGVHAARETAQHEIARIDAEAVRLREIPDTFGPVIPPPLPTSSRT